jgi:hypothetical protein
MPILGITQQRAGGTGLPRIAKVHKGGPKIERKNAKNETYLSVGEDLEYFRVEFAEGYEFLSADFAQMYGAEPRELPVMFNNDTVDQVLDAWYEDWDSHGTMLHRCDGAVQAVCYNKSTGYFEHNRACVTPACKCKKTARLELIMLGFMEATGILGTITFETHSDQDIRTLYARLSSYQAMLGSLRGVPMILRRAPREIGAPKTKRNPQSGEQVRTGERVKITRSLVDLLVDPGFVRNHIKGTLNRPSAIAQGQSTAPALPASGMPQLPPHWTEGTTLLKALEEAVQHDVRVPTDFEGDKALAMGAVVAWKCDYDLQTIPNWTTEHLGPDTQTTARERASHIAKERHDALMSMVDTDPIPGEASPEIPF